VKDIVLLESAFLLRELEPFSMENSLFLKEVLFYGGTCLGLTFILLFLKKLFSKNN
jgi:hypothetical protein